MNEEVKNQCKTLKQLRLFSIYWIAIIFKSFYIVSWFDFMLRNLDFGLVRFSLEYFYCELYISGGGEDRKIEIEERLLKNYPSSNQLPLYSFTHLIDLLNPFIDD